MKAKPNFLGKWGVREWRAYVRSHMTAEQNKVISATEIDRFVNDFRKMGGRKHPFQTLTALFAQRKHRWNRAEEDERLGLLVGGRYNAETI